MQEYEMIKLIDYFLSSGITESEIWDYKQEWLKNKGELLKDIICFANIVHDKDCYLIFGISDSLKVTGMKMPRLKQSDIIDTISHLQFAGDNYPHIKLQTVLFEGNELDVLTIKNCDATPIYLKKDYGKMKKGCIYTRVGDRNTPDKENAEVEQIESLWKKRLGLTKPILYYIYKRMKDKAQWERYEGQYYNIYDPKLNILIDYDNERPVRPFYSYLMVNYDAFIADVYIRCYDMVLHRSSILSLDGTRLLVPLPDLRYIVVGDKKIGYNYYIKESDMGILLYFLYNERSIEESSAFDRLCKAIIIFDQNGDISEFETYIALNAENLNRIVMDEIDMPNNVPCEDAEKIKYGYALNKMYQQFLQHRQTIDC